MKDWFINVGLSTLYRVLPFLFIMVVGILAVKLIMKIVNKALSKSKMEKAAHSLIRSLTRTVLYLLVCLAGASRLGIDVTGVIALAILFIVLHTLHAYIC